MSAAPSFKLLRYRDLLDRGLVNSRAMLKIMIDQYGFPEGKRLTPNCRTWTEAEVLKYYESQPTERKDTTALNAPWDWNAPRGRRGRPKNPKQKKTKRAAANATA